MALRYNGSVKHYPHNECVDLRAELNRCLMHSKKKLTGDLKNYRALQDILT